MASFDKSGDTRPETPALAARNVLHPLHEAAMRLAEMGITRNSKGFKTRDLVAMLLSHGARAWRMGQPRVAIHLYIGNDRRRCPVYMRIDTPVENAS